MLLAYRRASIAFSRYHSVLEGERDFRLVVELPCTSLAVWIYSVPNETIPYSLLLSRGR